MFPVMQPLCLCFLFFYLLMHLFHLPENKKIETSLVAAISLGDIR